MTILMESRVLANHGLMGLRLSSEFVIFHTCAVCMFCVLVNSLYL